MTKKRVFGWLFMSMAVMLFGVGCGTPHPEVDSLSLSKTTVAPGEKLDVTLKVKNFSFVAGEHGSHGGHGEHGTGGESTEMKGHYHIYFDDKAEVVAMATTETYSITIPNTMAEGAHKLRVELVTTAHSVLNPTVTQEVSFTVKK